MKHVSLDSWSRKDIFEYFSGLSNPFYSITFKIDVTEVCRYVKFNGLSFYYAMIYLCTKAVNQVEAFRYMLDDCGSLVLLDKRDPSFADLNPGSDAFHIVTIPCEGDIAHFCKAAKEQSRAQTVFQDPAAGARDLIYFSCVPWVEMTGLTDEQEYAPDDSVPHIIWGKYAEETGRKILHISLKLNHRFIDGVHIGKFHDVLSNLIKELA